MSNIFQNKTLLKRLAVAIVAICAAALLFVGAGVANAANGNPSTANEEGEIQLDVRKTAEWTNIPERTNANVTIDIKANEKISENPNFLFIGTMCSAHTLTVEKLVAAINGAAEVGSVDWFVYGNDFEGTYNDGHLEKGQKIKKSDLSKLKVANHQTLGSFYDTIGKYVIDYGYQYDNIIMEFDRSRIADYYGQIVQHKYIYNHESEYQDAVAKLMVDYYNRQKIIWIVDKDQGVEDQYTPSRYYYARNAWQSLTKEQYHALVGLMAPKYYETSDYYYDYDNIPEDAAVASDRQTHYNSDPDVIADFIKESLTKPKFLIGLDDTLVSREEAKIKPNSVTVEIEDEWGQWVPYEESKVVRVEQNVKFLSGFFTGLTHLRLIINFDDAGMYKVTDDGSTEKDPNLGKVRVDMATEHSGDKSVEQPTEKPLDWPVEDTYYVKTEVVNGTIDPSMRAAAGENVKVNYQPYSGFWLSKIYIDGQEMSPIQPEYNNQYIFHSIVADHSIKVVYTQDPDKILVKYVDSEDISTVYDIQAIPAGTCAKVPATPTKEGMDFVNWYMEKECKNVWDSNKALSENTVIYAGWKTKQYAVHFLDSMDLTEYKDLLKMVEYGGTVEKPTKAQEPTKEGYTFTGWYTDEKCKTLFDFDNKHIYETTNIYAGWVKNNYTVKFVDSMDVSTELAPRQTVKYNELCTQPDDPTKQQYSFTGWYTDKECTKLFSFLTPITKDTTLYAGWVAKPIYQVKFVDSMDVKTEVSPAQSVIQGDKASKPLVDPEKYGYRFTGWYTDKDCKTEFNFNTAIMQDTTVYAGWAEDFFTVIFVDSMDISNVYYEQSVRYMEKCNRPYNDPTKEGYNFTKWYADEDCSAEFDFNTPIEGNTMVFAGWELKDVHVKFVDSMDVTKELSAMQTVKWNTTCTKPATDPTKEEYYFSGWYTSKECTTLYDFNTPVKADMTLYAGWQAKPVYPVTFVDSMDTATVYDKQSIIEGHTATEPKTKPTKEGYTFNGWYADKECKNTYDFDTKIYKATTVYAGWKINKYAVVYVDSEDYQVYKTENVEYMKKTTPPDDPTKPEKEFTEWFADASCKTKFNFDTPITQDTFIYAGWKDIPKYNVVFLDSIDYKVLDQQKVLEGNCCTRPDDPSRPDYVFTGWYSDQECTKSFDFNTHIYHDTYVYAGWVAAPPSTVTVIFVDSEDITHKYDTQELNAGDKAKQPTDPTKEHKDFTGWYTDNKCTTKFDFNTEITVNTIVYAGWKDKPIYTVRFLDSIDFSEVADSQQVERDQLAVQPKDPEREQYTFNGWYTTVKCETKFDFNKPITEDTIVYAGWTGYTPSEVSVKFVDSEGISTIYETQTFKAGGKATRPEKDPVKAGKAFTGWYADKKCTKVFDFDQSINVNTIVYAGWIPVHNVVFLDSIDLSEVADTQVVKDGECSTKPTDDPSREGLVFTGWYSDQECTESFDFSTPIHKDTYVYAGWVVAPPSTVTVIFVDSEDITHKYDTQKLNAGDKAKQPTDPTKEHKDFTGWYADKKCTAKFDFSTAISVNTIVYAGWKDKPICTVRFLDSIDFSEVAESQQVERDQTAKQPADPERAQYTFTGWYTTAKCETKFDFDTPITEDTIVYAGWTGYTPSTVSVLFVDSQNISTIYDTQTFNVGGKATIPDNPKKEGYSFNGWYKDKACTTKFDFNQEIKVNTIVYAGWTPLYKVAFLDSIDFSKAADTQIVKDGGFAKRPTEDPTREGLVFNGWYADKECTTAFDFEGTAIHEDTFVFAGWSQAPAKKVYVRFVDSENISTVYETQKLDTGQRATQPTDPTKEHKDFTGWYADQACTVKFDFNKPVTVNTIVYAGWKDIPIFTVYFLDSIDYSSVAPSQKVERDSVATQPNDPSREGYVFNGWYTDSSCTTKYDFSTPITENTYVFAGWTEGPTGKVSVIFVDSENQSTVYDTQTFDVGGKATKPKDPEKASKAFTGWYSDKKCTKPFDFDQSINVNTVVYAGWTLVYNVAFLDSIDFSTLADTQVVKDGELAKRPQDDPVREGLVFSGWYKDQYCREVFDFNSPIHENTNVYAGWVDAPKSMVTVIFVDSEDISVRYDNLTQWFPIGEKATRPEEADEPKKDWETFTGWYADKECWVPFDFEQPITQNTIVYAGWYPKAAVVYVDLLDYKMSNGEESALKKIDAVDVFDFSVPPENPDRERYIFTGWYYDYECTERFIPEETPIIDDMIVYAGWVDAIYVKFVDSMDVSHEYDNQKIPVNTACAKPTDPTKEGYTFTKWYADKDCTTEFDLTQVLNTDTTVYAGWSKNPGPQPGPDPQPGPNPQPGPGDDTNATGTGSTGDSAWMLIVGAVVAAVAGVGMVVYRRKMQKC